MLTVLALQVFGLLADPSAAPQATTAVADPPEAPRTCADPPYGQVSQVEYVGSTINPTGNPIGGGYGYTDTGWPGPGDRLVQSVPDLLWALAVARTTVGPDRIWLNPAGDFDFSSWVHATPVDIPDDVTLFSMRGTSVPGGPDGAHVHMDKYFNGTLFRAGRNVRFYGLRIQGPSTGTEVVDSSRGIVQGESTYDTPTPGNLEIDNCELWGWTIAAVDVANRTGAYIHHNYFHENQRDHLGYGVVFGSRAQGRVIGNLFDRNRHAIASDGRSTSYEAAWNTVMAKATQHAFDMHGRADRCDTETEQENDPDCAPGAPGSDAGEWMYIHHNTFLQDDDPGVIVRGVVRQCAWIENNYFAHGDVVDDAVELRNVGSMSAAHVALANNRTDWFGVLWSAGGTQPWNALVPKYVDPVNGVLFGDFDADGKDDMFRITSDGHWWFRLTGIPAAGLPADEGWFDMGVRAPGAKLTDMAIGDFDGNQAADIFVADGARWSYFSYGYGPWIDLGAHPERRATLRFGRFDSDGRTDVFKTRGGRWLFSSGGTPGWTSLASSNVALGELRFGDFVGDDRTDVFRAADGLWRVSDAGRGAWSQINKQPTPASLLRFVDLDGDGRTDVFAAQSGVWAMSAAGATPWRPLGGSNHPLAELGFADVDGDGKSDVIFAGSP